MFTAEELEEMRKADAEIEENFVLTAADCREQDAFDKNVREMSMPNKERANKERKKAYDKAWYEANKERQKAYANERYEGPV